MRRIAELAAALALAGSAAPATADELSGVWTNAWYTPLQRPKGLSALAVTPAEAEAYEAPRRALNGRLPSAPGDIGQNESEFMDQGPGLARIRGEIRSSWIVDPVDGRLPWKPGAKEKLMAAREAADATSDIHRRHTDDRCLTVTGAAAPMINSPEANIVTIVQTPDAVLLAGEKNHEYRIVRLGAAARLPPDPPSRLGSSTGVWVGKTLVVTTTGWPPGGVDPIFGVALSAAAKVVERFTRTGPAEITYLFEVEDPNLYARTWKAEMIFRASQPMYEFACHEGNYAMAGMLNATRMEAEANAAAAARESPPAR